MSGNRCELERIRIPNIPKALTNLKARNQFCKHRKVESSVLVMQNSVKNEEKRMSKY